MTKKQNRNKESPLVAFVMTERNTTILITPHGEYSFAHGRLINTTSVDDYAGRVRERLQKIADQVKVGNRVYSDKNIIIQIRYGSDSVKLS